LKHDTPLVNAERQRRREQILAGVFGDPDESSNGALRKAHGAPELNSARP
jgi:hypothetical protein